MYCPNCKKTVSDTALFCPDCGTKTEDNPVPLCSTCQSPLTPDMLFCPNCGTPVKQKKASAPVTQRKATASSTPNRTSRLPLIVTVTSFATFCILAVVVLFLMEPWKKNPSVSSTSHSESIQNSSVASEAQSSGKDAIEKAEGQNSPASQEAVNSENPTPENNTANNAASQTDAPLNTETQITANAVPETPATTVPSETSAAAPTPTEIPKTFAYTPSRSEQENLILPGAQLDISHMSNLLSQSGASFGSYILDITNMQDYDSGNADTPMPASALISVPILFTAAVGVDSGAIQLDASVPFSYTFENGRGVFSREDHGKTFPLSQLLGEALRNSDNNALNSLIDYLSMELINSTCHDYGYDSVNMQRILIPNVTDPENYISARDASMMLNAVYHDNFSGIGKSFVEEHFKIIRSDTSDMGMAPVCRNLTKFLNMNGFTDSKYNEIAFIENNGETFIICVFTSNGNYINSASAVTNFTKYVTTVLAPL